MSEVLTEVRDGVLIITLNRPEAKNAANRALSEGVAAALDRPLVALYGSSDPHHTPPMSERASILHLGLPCSPCFARECPLGHLKCLRDIAPEQVIERLAPRLAEALPKA